MRQFHVFKFGIVLDYPLFSLIHVIFISPANLQSITGKELFHYIYMLQIVAYLKYPLYQLLTATAAETIANGPIKRSVKVGNQSN